MNTIRINPRTKDIAYVYGGEASNGKWHLQLIASLTRVYFGQYDDERSALTALNHIAACHGMVA